MRRALLASVALLLAGAAPAAAADDASCTGSYGTDPAKAGPPLRFGIDSELAGNVGTGQGTAAPLDWAKDAPALRKLTPPGKQMVLRVNRLFWAEGDEAIRRFQAVVDKHAAAGFDSELQVRYHPAEGDEGNIAKWEAYVRHVVDTLGADRHVVSMTITNEVNLAISQNTSDGAYQGATDALVKGVIAARDEADRIGRTDLQFGFTYAYRWNPQSDAAFWKALAAGGPAFRAALGFVGVDVYPGTFYPPAVSPLSSYGEEVVEAIATVRKCFMPQAQLGMATPIWITENGAQSGAAGDDAGQAAALEDMISRTIAVSGTYHVTDYRWFNLRDNVTGSPAMFNTAGLLRDDYSEKPSLERYRALVAAHGADRPAAPSPAPAPTRRCVRRVTVTLPAHTRRFVARLDGRRVPGRRHGRRLTVTFNRAGRRHVVVTARTRSGRRIVLRRAATACAAAPRARAAARLHARTVVTLEFDVATDDQVLALPLLARHGMHATFFVNSGLVGRPGHLTFDQLRDMQAAGHEIAGQTISHARLTRLTPAGVRHEVCDDRARLLARGLAVDAFAYPYGAYSGRIRDVVVRCGYTSARLASGIRGGGNVCSGCPYAETLPPHNRFATRMPAAVQKTSTVLRLIQAVRDAQRTGGGWVQLLMHHVCVGCHRYSIPPDRLRRLLAWLDRQPGVEIRTVSQLMDAGGPSVRLAAPSKLGSQVTLPVTYRAPRGVRRVRYFLDGRPIGVRSISPWRLKWFPRGVRPGRHELRALLEDETGNAALSQSVPVVKP